MKVARTVSLGGWESCKAHPATRRAKYAHINMLGRYHFELDDLATEGNLRPLRDPDSLDALEITWKD